ncbi:hypothetical protein HYV44_00130 [Candidatus Microgenomates bacterium]|nr:hypothetical protein [Candidatus Microgenomates bacterium]
MNLENILPPPMPEKKLPSGENLFDKELFDELGKRTRQAFDLGKEMAESPKGRNLASWFKKSPRLKAALFAGLVASSIPAPGAQAKTSEDLFNIGKGIAIGKVVDGISKTKVGAKNEKQEVKDALETIKQILYLYSLVKGEDSLDAQELESLHQIIDMAEAEPDSLDEESIARIIRILNQPNRGENEREKKMERVIKLREIASILREKMDEIEAYRQEVAAKERELKEELASRQREQEAENASAQWDKEAKERERAFYEVDWEDDSDISNYDMKFQRSYDKEQTVLPEKDGAKWHFENWTKTIDNKKTIGPSVLVKEYDDGEYGKVKLEIIVMSTDSPDKKEVIVLLSDNAYQRENVTDLDSDTPKKALELFNKKNREKEIMTGEKEDARVERAKDLF